MMYNLGCMNYTYDNLHFMFVVSNDIVRTELEELISNFTNQYTIYVANNTSSNKLRSYGTKATTPYVYFHDCDDWANYELLNNVVAEYNIGDNIYCLNVLKHHYDSDGEICAKDKLLFHMPNGLITNISNIPTCVYSKIIPTKHLQHIDFPNLPYSQDWAISYQLYPLVNHIFDNRVSYYYNNYPTSSSHFSFDNKYRIMRVAAYSRTICRKMDNYGLYYEADFLRVKYSINICDRFRKMGEYIAPNIPTIRVLNKTTHRARLSIIYHTIMNIFHYIIKR